MTDTKTIQPVLLVILDGFGVAPPSQGNAVTLAKTPVFNKLTAAFPSFTLQASGEAVGLPWGEMGNSEVGHLNLGAGKIIWQSLPRITRSISDNSFFQNQAFLKTIDHAKKHHSTLHLTGLVSNGAVHSSNNHLYALLELAKQQEFKDICIHAILDGRDTAKDSGLQFIQELQDKIKEIGIGKIASLSGRFFAMDRDNHWERVGQTYAAMTGQEVMIEDNKDNKQKGSAKIHIVSDPITAIQLSYKKQVYDEEFIPVIIGADPKEIQATRVKNNDAIIYFNFRTDRARELTKAFVSPDFKGFKRNKLRSLLFVTMTEYQKGLPVEIAFPPEEIKNPLARIISEQGLKQFHTAETEKYAHVTFFFNGRTDDPFPGEERKLIPSPRVASYADQPEMSAPAVSQAVIGAIESKQYHFVLVNFANPDMVGHTGDLQATIKAIETLDNLLGQVVDSALKNNWITLIIADHGNAEEMVDLKTGEIIKEHTTNPVPFIVVDPKKENHENQEPKDLTLLTPIGVLSDIAPTILKLMGLSEPSEMTGNSLV